MIRLVDRGFFVLSLIAAAVFYLLARDQAARRAVKSAERAQAKSRQTTLILKSKEAQDEARARAAHTQPDLLNRLRRGSF